MTNEELVLMIQNGDTGMIAKLWEQVHKLVFLYCNRFFNLYSEKCAQSGITIDDLTQEGYFAMLDAAEAYKEDSGFLFTAYLKYPLKNRFNTLVGFRTIKSREEPLNNSLSLDSPINENDPDLTLGDMVEHAGSKEDLEGVLEADYQKSLHNAVEESLSYLPGNNQSVIKSKYFEGKTVNDIARERGVARETIQRLEQKGLRALRYGKPYSILKPYAQELMSSYAYKGTGLQSFKETGASSPERAVIKIMELEEKYPHLFTDTKANAL